MLGGGVCVLAACGATRAGSSAVTTTATVATAATTATAATLVPVTGAAGSPAPVGTQGATSVGTVSGTTATVPRGTRTPTPVPTPLPSPAAGAVHLGEGDAGSTVAVRVGTEIVVDLGGASNFDIWTAVTSSDESVVRTRSSSTPADGSSHATFGAESPGRTTLSARGDPRCYAQGCRAPSVLWRVTIDVSA